MTTFKKAYGPRKRESFTPTGSTMTQQNFKDECDINRILNKYQKTGVIEHTSKHHGDYSDLTNVVDYQTAMNIVIAADNAFSSLPSSIRKQFDNDPASFLAFAENPDNLEAMRDLGLADPLPIPQAPTPVTIIDPAPADPSATE